MMSLLNRNTRFLFANSLINMKEEKKIATRVHILDTQLHMSQKGFILLKLNIS